MSIIPTVPADQQVVIDRTVPSAGTSRPAAAVIVIGTADACHRARLALDSLSATESAGWNGLPGGPAVCIDADRFEYLSPQGIELLREALLHGHDVVVPASNIGQWPLCGLESPRGTASTEVLNAHSISISTLGIEHTVDFDCPLPAVFGVADAARIINRPNRVGDLADRAAVVSAAWCHHRQTLLITASMIVKNEAERIERAIASVQGFADEVVIYDTGSDDDTVELARRAGAAVRCGYWDDDFSRARNEAIKMGRGDWIVVIDADDELIGDDEGFDSVRRRLGGIGERDCVALNVHSVGNAATGEVYFTKLSRRMFRRDLRYRRRIHEEPFHGDGTLPDAVEFGEIAIRHGGYSGEMDEKWERNARLLALRVADSGSHDLDERARALMEYGRGLLPLERFDDAMKAFTEVIELDIGPEATNTALLLQCALVAEHQGKDAGMVFAARLIAGGGPFGDAARWTIAMYCEIEESLRLLEPVESVATTYVEASADQVKSTRALWRALSGDRDGAAAEVKSLSQLITKQNWWVAAICADGEDLSVAEFLAERATTADLAEAAASLAAAPPVGSHSVVTVLWQRFGAEEPLVLYLAQTSHRAGFMLALDARFMLMQAGRLDAGDPLESVIDHSGGSVDALLAAMVLEELEADRPSLVSRSAATIIDDRIPEALSAVEVVYPGGMGRAVEALGSTPARRELAQHIASLLAV